MSYQLFPREIDNTYRGYKAALWLFAFVVLSKTMIGVNAIVNGRYVASNADGIALDAFTPAGAQAVVSMFAIWGLAQLVLCALSGLALLRYRAAIPFMIAVVLLEHLIRRVILLVMPMARTGRPPGLWVNLVLLALLAVSFVLSLPRRTDREAGPTGS